MALTDNLISYWKLDEASGSALDAHGTNNLAQNNGPGSTVAILNNARTFDNASGQFLSVASNAGLVSGDIDFTIMAWFKMGVANAGMIVAKDSDTLGREYVLAVDDTHGLTFYVNGSAAGMIVAAAFSDTTSEHLVFAWHDSVANFLNLQLDNGSVVQTDTTGTAPGTGTAEFRIGARAYTGFENYWTGSIDEVGYWKRTLTSDERTSLWNSGAGYSYDIWGGGSPPSTDVWTSFSL